MNINTLEIRNELLYFIGKANARFLLRQCLDEARWCIEEYCQVAIERPGDRKYLAKLLVEISRWKQRMEEFSKIVKGAQEKPLLPRYRDFDHFCAGQIVVCFVGEEFVPGEIINISASERNIGVTVKFGIKVCEIPFDDYIDVYPLNHWRLMSRDEYEYLWRDILYTKLIWLGFNTIKPNKSEEKDFFSALCQ